jgi:hypothetical protein
MVIDILDATTNTSPTMRLPTIYFFIDFQFTVTLINF